MNTRTFVEKMEKFSKDSRIDFVKKLLVFNDIDSTNSTAKNLARAGAEEGTVVIAQTQNKGRGRFDRIWQSPEGGMYLSIILRPKISLQYASLLTFVAALTVVKTIHSYGLSATIKWPNDVRVQRKKIAGILLESEINGDHIEYVIVGIGINLNIDIQKLPSNIRSCSTSISSEVGSPIRYDEFFRTLFKHFDELYKRFNENQFEGIIREWKTFTDTLGKSICVRTRTEQIQGIALDVDRSGFLLLKTDRGEIRKIVSGDCLHCDEAECT